MDHVSKSRDRVEQHCAPHKVPVHRVLEYVLSGPGKSPRFGEAPSPTPPHMYPSAISMHAFFTPRSRFHHPHSDSLSAPDRQSGSVQRPAIALAYRGKSRGLKKDACYLLSPFSCAPHSLHYLSGVLSLPLASLILLCHAARPRHLSDVRRLWHLDTTL